MKSSYKLEKVPYQEIFELLISLNNPQNKIIEFGILEGFSLKIFAENTIATCQIKAYDIFEKFNGNGAKRDIVEKFSDHANVSINEGDFFEIYKSLENNSIDIFHIDIANTGDIYKFAIDNYLPKLRNGGLLLLEGGSEVRDNFDWMLKYNKTPIKPYLKSLKSWPDITVHTIETFPSLTIIQKNLT